jgi:hypothetical protein
MYLALVRMNDQARLVAQEGPSQGLKMFSFDSAGVSTGAPAVTLTTTPISATATDERVVAATSGSVLWVAWVAYPPEGDDQFRLMLRGFDTHGAPLTAAHVLEATENPSVFSNLQASGVQGRAVVAWNQIVPLVGRVPRYVMLNDATVTPVVLEASPSEPQELRNRAVASEHGLAMFWAWPAPIPDGSLGAVALDGAGHVLRTTAGSLTTNEIVSLPWLSRPNNLQISSDERVDLLAHDLVQLWPNELTKRDVCTLMEFTPGETAQAFRSSARLLHRYPCVGSRPVSLTKTVLVLADGSAGLMATPVWRRN